MIFFFSALLALAQAAPAPNVPILSCGQYVNLKLGSDYDLPPQRVSIGTCRNDFILPSNLYAHGYIALSGMTSSDVVVIQDGKYDTIRIYNRVGLVNVSLTFPSSFVVTVQSVNNTNLQTSMHASVYTATPKNNIVKSYVTFDGSASVFLYNNQWKEGESYKFSSKVANVAIKAAANGSLDEMIQLTNILIYDRSDLMGTLYSVAQHNQYISVTSEVTLYKVKPTTLDGAVLVTDYANVMPLGNYDVAYLSNVGAAASYDLITYNPKPAAITIIGPHDGSQAVDIQSLTMTKGTGQLSYGSGGPQPKSTLKPLGAKDLPAHVTGYANTFYLSSGSGTLTVKATKK